MTKIPLIALRTNSIYILFSCIILLLAPEFSLAQETKPSGEVQIEAKRDSVVLVADSLSPATRIVEQDTIIFVEQDSIKIDSVKTKAPLLSDVITYEAEDYMRISRKENRMYLFDQAQITYGDMVITAGLIIMDNEKNEVYAYGIPDSTGAYSQRPIFTQAQNTVEPD